jgi:hypothetical protein
MKKDFQALPKGTVIIAAVKDDGSKRLKYSAKRMFMNMGSKKIWKLGYKKGWAFLGVKGMKQGVEQYGKSAEFGVVMGYVKIEKKVKRVQKVKGGSRIEGLSAGSETGSTARILINGEDVLE